MKEPSDNGEKSESVSGKKGNLEDPNEVLIVPGKKVRYN